MQSSNLKRFSTDIAFVEPLVLVERHDVALQRVGPGVGLVAEVTLVLPRARVELHVGLQVAAGVELEVTGGARVGLVAGVGPLVSQELSSTGELFAALLARVRLLPGVRPAVQPESFLDGELLVADFALVRHLARVGPHVNSQAADLNKLRPNKKMSNDEKKVCLPLVSVL